MNHEGVGFVFWPWAFGFRVGFILFLALRFSAVKEN
jgi:hypothetical protein